MDVFLPGSTLAKIQDKYGKGEKFKVIETVTVYRFMVAKMRFKFPVFVQIYQNNVLDFFAKLPSYFSHDLYHQSLINKFGKQDKYLKQENNALYSWNNENGSSYLYSGSCTITCFPIYFFGKTNTPPQGLIYYKSLIQQMKDSRLY